MQHPPVTTKHDISQKEMEQLLVGACELGLLESAWEYFVNKPKYQYLFVIDAPKISSVYALPPNNIAHFGIAGLLDAPDAPANLKNKPASARQAHYKEEAKKYPLTLGLTEILARYLFSRRWSSGEPKLMMSSQTNSIGDLMDAVARSSSHEFTQTFKRSGDGNPLQDLQKKYMNDRSKDAGEFIDDVTRQLEKYLPAIYGAYTDTRRLLRYAQALPFPDRPDEEQETVFARSYEVINELLTLAERETLAPVEGLTQTLRELTKAWIEAIPRSGKRATSQEARPINDKDDVEETLEEEESTEAENARTLAEIEYLNRQFRERGMPQRLVFVTTTGRLFQAVLTRYGFASHSVSTPNVLFGSKSNYEKCRYFSRLLVDDNSDLSLMPMLDPRALMMSSDFVNYANRESNASVDDNAREISAWLPAFFADYLNSSGDMDVALIFRTYQHYQSTQTRKRIDVPITSVDSFSPQHYSILKESWDKYIRIVSAAEGIERIMQREAFHDIRVQLIGKTSLQELMGKRLDDAMSQWLAIVGGNALQASLRTLRGKKSTAPGTGKFRVVPPLILPSFSSERVSLFRLMQHLNSHGPIFTENQFSWLTNPKASDFEIDEADPRKDYKTRYVQMLGQAFLFASLNNWDAAYRLSTQAYALAEQFLRDDDDRLKSTYVSGREAAYFASVAARRLRTSWGVVDRSMDEGYGWVAKYRKAIDGEPYVRQFPFRHELLRIRGDLEQMAWETFSLLYRMYRFKLQEVSLPMLGERELDELRYECSRISELLLSERLIPAKNENQFDSKEAKQAYMVTYTYLLRQVWSVGLHVELLVAPDIQPPDNARIKQLVQLIEDTICQECNIEHEDCLPLSSLEQLLLLAGHKVAEIPLPAEPVAPIENQESVGFGLWRYEELSKLAGEALQPVTTSV